MEFKNSFYNVAVETAKQNTKTAGGQLALIDNLTMNTPILASVPFQRASHPYHHVYSRLMDAQGMQKIDFDGTLPTLRAEAQLEEVKLTPFGGKFQFGEDLAIQAAGTPDAYLATQVVPSMRKTGMDLERSLYINNFLTKAIEYGNVQSVSASASAGNQYGTMLAITWEPGEMTGLYSPLPYGSGSNLGQLFETRWLNNKIRHELPNGVIGFAASVKIFIGMLLANKRKIAALVNIAVDEVPTPEQLAKLVIAAEYSGSTRIYCSAALKIQIAAKYAQQQKGNGLVGVSGTGEVTVVGVPIVTSNNIPGTFKYVSV